MSTLKNDFDSEAFLEKCSAFSTSRRQKLLRQLVKKDWFIASDPAIQEELARLPQDGHASFDGFIENMLRRSDHIGDITVKRLLSIPHGNFIVCPVFEVYNALSKLTYTYEYAAFRYEVPTGAKGLLFIREDRASEPTHFIILSGEKFATSELTYELIGGLAETDEKEIIAGIIIEIQEECGVKNLVIDEVVLLGSLVVDPGFTSHETHLFAAYITPSEAKRISAHAKNIDDRELNTYVHILPLTKLAEIVHDTNNAMLLGAVTKAPANGMIPKQYCNFDYTAQVKKSLKPHVRTDLL